MTCASRDSVGRSAPELLTQEAAEPPAVSVVIPTFNRMDTLPEVLEAVCRQRITETYEVIVVDDGSDAPTAEFLRQWLASGPRRLDGGALAVRVALQDNRGPAAARNLGVELARAPRVAFLGDDTVPSRGWLAAHRSRLEAARAAGLDPDRTGIIGYTRWHPRMRLDPFLRYINEFGLQFGYALIEDADDVPFNFFYTSNLSVPREALLEEPFDTGFPYPAWEDIEVSYRLQQRGFRLLYEASAVVDHDHPTDLARFGVRQEKAGYCAVVFYRRHPELGDFLGLGAGGPPPLHLGAAFRWKWRLVRALQRWRVPASLPAWWEETLRTFYLSGLHRGWHDGAGLSAPDKE